jgi:hypothetical protein
MDLKAHLAQLEQLLVPYQKIWGQEIIHHFKAGLKDYPQAWLHDALSLSHYELWQLDCNTFTELSDSSLKEFFQTLSCASVQPSPKENSKNYFDSKLFFRVKGKKLHEVSALLGLLEERRNEEHKSLIDIGAGQGHLTRICAEKLSLNCHAIEQNSDFIALGLKRLKYSPLINPKSSLKFHHQTFGEARALDLIIDKDGETTILLGLHTCGALAIDQLKVSERFNKLTNINIPCCYQKLTDLKLCNLSGHVQLPWSSYALTLAARAHGHISYADFCHKERVKYYRYALHWFLQEFYLRDDFQSVGDSAKRDYRGSFSSYLKSKIEFLKLDPKPLQKVDPHKWYLSAHVQQTLRELFVANIIRWRFGQALEQILLIDRALWMEDKGFNVKIEKIFDSNQSPRAHAISVY